MATLLPDFDGALHPDAAFLVRDQVLLRGPAGVGLFEWARLLADALEPRPAIGLVLSTRRVNAPGYETARRPLCSALQQRLLRPTDDLSGSLDPSGWIARPHWGHIHLYVERHTVDYRLAIDDDAGDWPGNERFRLLLTCADLGIAPVAKLEELVQRLAWPAGMDR